MPRPTTRWTTIALAFGVAACTANRPATGDTGGAGAANAPVATATRAAPARAELRDVTGRPTGTVTFTQTPHGVLIATDVTALPAGIHAIHFHEVGRCDPPFTSAEGHFNPARRVHGFKTPAGPHAGDLPNFSVPAGGSARVDHLSRDVTLGAGPTSLFDADSTAIIVHASADDYQTDPAGDSGARIACGVVRR